MVRLRAIKITINSCQLHGLFATNLGFLLCPLVSSPPIIAIIISACYGVCSLFDFRVTFVARNGCYLRSDARKWLWRTGGRGPRVSSLRLVVGATLGMNARRGNGAAAQPAQNTLVVDKSGKRPSQTISNISKSCRNQIAFDVDKVTGRKSATSAGGRIISYANHIESTM